MSRRTKVTLCFVSALLAVAVILYPLVSNYLGEKNRSLVQSQYTEAVKELDDSMKIAAREAARSYNATLVNVTDKAFSKEALAQAAESYDELLNIRGDGVMGYVEIPKISVNLPVYHGTEESSLERGAGHLLGSSLPVGGIGTHCVITGHSGLAGQRMFSDLNQLKTGDVFYLHVLDETLAYMILDINTVLPEDTSELTVDPVRDSCTLLTCTPYGVNTHRLLLRGERIEYTTAERIEERKEENGEEAASTWTEEYMHGIAYGLLGVSAVFLIVKIFREAKALKALESSAPTAQKNVFHGETHFRATVKKTKPRQRKRGKHEANH